ncbi:ankyrin repeat domain-containing protein [Candidatus Thiosymbion oneisti]|uniref:ankyrin repeat domain-containing protein n=1 Tax=Candidatus Thiosymbion oneisti TaxID=589554 RepID=UPI000B7DA9CF|nr:ankyrin repeat domain-containing protein [Candidatus Thiosymbion oneisti]
MSPVRVPAALALAALLLAACGEPPPPTINLYRAIQGGDLDQIKRHIYWGTDIDRADPRGELPLHAAVRRGRLIIVRELLKNGADPNATNQAGETPLQVALVAGRTQLAAILIEADATDDPQALLFILVRAGVDDRDSLAFLTRRGADVDAKDQAGATPLHIAVGDGQRLLTKRLIDLGANVDAPDGDGRTLLSIAIENGNQPIIDLLERFGARAEPATSTR